MGWAPALFLPATTLGLPFRPLIAGVPANQSPPLSYPDFRLAPHYPAKAPLDDVLRLVQPGSDEFVTEAYAFEIMLLLDEWSRRLTSTPLDPAAIGKFLDASIEANSLLPMQEIKLRPGDGLEVFRRRFADTVIAGRDRFLAEIKMYLGGMSQWETAEFEIVSVEETAGLSPAVNVAIRYDLVGTLAKTQRREERVGQWRTRWSRDQSGAWRARKWEAREEIVSRASGPVFIDITSQTVGRTESYKTQMLRGIDHWRTVLDGACGIDVYGNNGVAVGDIDNDGFDDVYVCQPSGLPNRLYRNRGDGTFEDVSVQSGVDVLDNTACAIFADFQNRGLQDLLVVCASGPLLFLNQGQGKFLLKNDAFKFARPPQGTFTHAAIADYDGDGLLDIYFCLYSYYLGLDQYHYPAPYFDARNGPPNFLFHNQGAATFQDRTAAAGLNVDNDRYSFACAWGRSTWDGLPDLYVANDFGRSNLYRNRGDGTFASVSAEAGVQEPGAGMSASWLDFDSDGSQDVYVANMWSAAGIRVSEQKIFHETDPEDIRALYRHHARGNSLYRNQGNGKFQNVSAQARIEMGRWAWSSDSWDFDHDGYPDLYIANGYISGPDSRDLSSFFWRQVVAKSPRAATPALHYEQGWNAINELVRSDSSWSGRERNVLYANNHDGTFSEVSGTMGLDFPDDSRAFALSDLDHDGRMEVILKNRNAPQLRVLHNAMKDLGNSIALRLRGTKSNRDAIGAAVTIEATTTEQAIPRQTRYLQAGSGFLSQHTKEVFFGVGKMKTGDAVRATIRWPSGLTQVFEHLPVNQRIEVEEGSTEFASKPFASAPPSYTQAGEIPTLEALPSSVETWLIDPLSAPDFSLPDVAGRIWELKSLRGSFLFLSFWTTVSPSCTEQMRLLEQHHADFRSRGLLVTGINVDAVGNDNLRDSRALQAFLAREKLSFPTLIATPDVAGVYNIVYRYLFDRRRDLALPTSFLIDQEGVIVKLYQGPLNSERLTAILREDLRSVPRTRDDRIRKALPWSGTLCQETFERNDFTYGVAFFQHGYLHQAESSFKQVIALKPYDPEAHYNLGTLYLKRNALSDARQYLEQTVKLRPDYPEAWNNLGMLDAQEGRADAAVENFQQSLRLRPDYAIALVNLGNLYRREGKFGEAEQYLSRALALEPDNPEANYNLGMLYARLEQLDRAAQYLDRATALRPDYSDALNNLGVLFVRQKNYSAAEEKFKACIRVAPNFDQAYLNLARVYVILNDKEKARAVLHTLLNLQPQHRVAQQALEMLN
jgi:Flp pilus assembly protein TadD/peroxiredoxin